MSKLSFFYLFKMPLSKIPILSLAVLIGSLTFSTKVEATQARKKVARNTLEKKRVFKKKPYKKKWEFEMLVGPPSLANGGSNPVSVPPSFLVEYEATLTTKSRWHFRLGLSPHIVAAGKLFKLKYGFQTAIGASVVNSLQGYGPGIFSVFGWHSPCAVKRVCFSAQYIQDVGVSITEWKITTPFAVRMGLVWKI